MIQMRISLLKTICSSFGPPSTFPQVLSVLKLIKFSSKDLKVLKQTLVWKYYTILTLGLDFLVCAKLFYESEKWIKKITVFSIRR